MIVYLSEYGRDDPEFVGLHDTPEAAIQACRSHKYFSGSGQYGDFIIRAIEVNGDILAGMSFCRWKGRDIIKAGKAGAFLAEWSDPEWAAQPYG